MSDLTEAITLFAIGFGLLIFIAIACTIPTWSLWNWLCPKLFGLPKISLLESLGLLLLTGFLFRSSSSNKD